MSIIVTCKRGDGDREAPTINDTLIVTENMAASRGKRFLDDPAQGGYYLTRKRSIKVPVYSDEIVPNAWLNLSCSQIGISEEIVKIKNCSLTIKSDSIWLDLDTESYEEF